MARKQSVIVLGIAVLLGLVAVYLVNVYLSGAEQQRTGNVSLSKVAVARVPLEFGAPVTPDKIQFVDFPASSVPPGSFTSPAQFTSIGANQMALRPIEVGEPVLKSKLSGGGRATLSALLPPDMRAVAIGISDVSGVAGFVLPGDRVDVFITRQTGQGTNNQQTDVLLQDIRVIAVDQDANDNANKPSLAKTATLEVNQYDAQKLALAQTVGSLSLALRSAKALPGQAYATRISAADLGRAGPGTMRPTVRPASYVGYSRPIRRANQATRQAQRTTRIASAPVRSSVEIVRGVAANNYDVGVYRGN